MAPHRGHARRGEPVAVIVPIADYVQTDKRKDFWKAYLDWKKSVDPDARHPPRLPDENA